MSAVRPGEAVILLYYMRWSTGYPQCLYLYYTRIIRANDVRGTLSRVQKVTDLKVVQGYTPLPATITDDDIAGGQKRSTEAAAAIPARDPRIGCEDVMCPLHTIRTSAVRGNVLNDSLYLMTHALIAIAVAVPIHSIHIIIVIIRKHVNILVHIHL